MAVLCRHYDGMEECARALTRRRLPHQVRKGSGDFRPLEDSIKVMTMHVSKGLEFPIVAVMGPREPSTKQDEVQAEVRLLYVAATRATQRLFIATTTPA
jgi:superfamily I DNA/RNA helicase